MSESKLNPKTQAEIDAAVAAYPNGEQQIDLTGADGTAYVREKQTPWFTSYDSSQPRVEAYDSSQPRVVANGSSQPRVVAYGSSQPRVEAYGSSQPRVEAYDSSQPRVVANDSSQPRVVANDSSQPRVVANGSSQLSVKGAVTGTAGPDVAIAIEGSKAKIEGGRQVHVKRTTPAEWCAYYGIEVKDGVAILFKGVADDFRSPRGIFYTPGTTPEAPDWDGMERECGGGLHFSPRPRATLEFNREATKFVACPVALEDIVVHPDGDYPQKIKARRVCAPCWEVNEDGDPVSPVAKGAKPC